MASIPGGPADKLGNEFERLWTVRFLLEVVAGHAVSVEIEPLGPDEVGTEFWVSRTSGEREAHQCKRENGTVGKWSVSDLAGRGVISKAQFQLNRDPRHRFVFASGDKAPLLADLAQRAAQYDLETFYRQAVLKFRDHASEFAALCRHLGKSPDVPNELAEAADFLRRFKALVIDPRSLRADLEERASRWLLEDPATAVAVLESLATDSIGKTLREQDILDRLSAHGIHACDLIKHRSLTERIKELRETFRASYRHLLINGKALEREETRQLLAMLTDPNGPRLILLHGAGGHGKSGVVFELTDLLSSRGVPHLPLRLDHFKPADTPYKYGQILGLPQSPVASLAAAADSRNAVLILDQVDAIRWTTAHSALAWNTCERLINAALLLPNMRIVVVCRTFDVEDDSRIRDWKKREHQHVQELLVPRLDAALVAWVIVAQGMDVAALDAKQHEVLRSPQALYVWCRLFDSEAAPPAFRTLTDLMRAFWKMIRQTFKELKPGDYEKPVSVLLKYMDTNGTLQAPESIVREWPNEVDALVSLNVITRGQGGRLLFAHQSYLDYLGAESLVGAIHTGERSVSHWLLQDEEQSLFRRGQLRQILTLLRDEDPAKYLETLMDLLTSAKVRFHLQHLALQMLGHADPPTADEATFVIDLLGDDYWRDHVSVQVLVGRTAWFDVLHQRGMVRQWFASTDASKQKLALYLMQWTIDSRGEEVHSIMTDGGRSSPPAALDAMLQWKGPAELSPSLFRELVKLTRRGSSADHYVDWKKLAQAKPKRCIHLLRASLLNFIRTCVTAPDEAHAWADRHSVPSNEIAAALTVAVVANPTQAWDKLMPCLERLSLTLANLRDRRHTRIDVAHHSSRAELRRVQRLLCRLLISAGSKIAIEGFPALWERIKSLAVVSSASVNRVIAYSLRAASKAHADEAIIWLSSEDRRFRCGTRRHGSRRGAGVYRPAFRLLRNHLKWPTGDTADTTAVRTRVARRPGSSPPSSRSGSGCHGSG